MRQVKKAKKRDGVSGIVPLRERILDALDIPEECLPHQVVTEVVGSRKAVIFGCCGVLVYTPDRIVLRVRCGKSELHGDGLEICSLVGDRVVVRGKIRAILPESTEAEEC